MVPETPRSAPSGETRPVDKSVSGPVLWFGGKGHLAGWIASHLPEHSTYVEPYGGAAAVLFTKQPAPIEVYNDLHGDLVNLMRVLRSDDAECYEAEHWICSEVIDLDAEQVER